MTSEREREREDESESVETGRDGLGEMSPALASLVAELRAEAPPEPAWDAIERQLMLRIARGEGGQRPGHGREAIQRVAPLFAAAAAITLAISFGASSGRPLVEDPIAPRVVDVSALPRAEGAAGARGDLDLAVLREGSAVESGAAPVAFSRAGVARWVLAPSSRVVVRSVGAASGVGAVLTLERGSIQADIEPLPPSEGLVDAFAIEAGGTRVAVHGTSFSVTRAAQSMVVDVEHGVVAVGPTGHRGATAGYSLVGPSRASFSLDGATKARFLPREAEPRVGVSVAGALDHHSAPGDHGAARSGSEPPTSAPPERSSPHAERAEHADPAGQASRAPTSTAAPAQAPAAPESTPPAAPPPEQTAPPPPAVAPLTAGTIKARIERCIKDTQRNSLTSTKVSIASTLQIKVDAGGAVVSAKLSPPLAPHLAPCAGQAIAGKFASGPSELAIPLSIVEE